MPTFARISLLIIGLAMLWAHAVAVKTARIALCKCALLKQSFKLGIDFATGLLVEFLY